MRQDVLVMENLFYDRKIDKVFDTLNMATPPLNGEGGRGDMKLSRGRQGHCLWTGRWPNGLLAGPLSYDLLLLYKIYFF